MKQHAEARTEHALKELRQSLTRLLTDTGIILEEFEATHDDAECDECRCYGALVGGHFAVKDAIDVIDRRLNKTNNKTNK